MGLVLLKFQTFSNFKCSELLYINIILACVINYPKSIFHFFQLPLVLGSSPGNCVQHGPVKDLLRQLSSTLT